MIEKHVLRIAEELKIGMKQVVATAVLLEDNATVPFIARYRKERTGNLDEVQIANIRDRLVQLAEIDGRRDSILISLAERNLLSESLKNSLEKADSLPALEDIYLPFRPKRKTRASIARERGLEPLARLIFEQASGIDPEKAAAEYVSGEKGVENAALALAGARDIIAEWISEDADIRKDLRALFEKDATVESRLAKGGEEEGVKFRDYFEWKEPVRTAPSHRLLAMFRGEKEGFLHLTVAPDPHLALPLLKDKALKGQARTSKQVELAIEDCYNRLLAPSMETETRVSLRQRAGEEAIRVFASNLRELLMAAPLGQKAVLALDPGFRTGCKLTCLDPQGKLQFDTALYISQSDRERREAGEVIRKLVAHFKVEAIAIGNGTASRETEAFVKSLGLPASIPVVMVNESGASIYSASEIAREEFPDKDVTVRGSVSIGRRLMDPLAELVKLDPKSIGVGQYQHDVDPGRLKQGLDDVVMSCVNSVGVEVNTASQRLLTYVSGLGPKLAQAIVDHRNTNGPFKSRTGLKKVPKLGAKAFEQAAGFLRIRGGAHPLDGSAVHPESYGIVERMAADLGCTVQDLMQREELRRQIQIEKYVTESAGLPTLRDIMSELAKPGRDPREKFEAFSFAENVHTMEDLKPGMKLPGIVSNVTKFGAFVDIGVHQDGLVHISELADSFVNDPADVVKVHQKVQVTVLEVDQGRKRIALSLKSNPGQKPDRVPRTGPAERRPGAPRNGGGRTGIFAPPGSQPFSNPFGSL